MGYRTNYEGLVKCYWNDIFEDYMLCNSFIVHIANFNLNIVFSSLSFHIQFFSTVTPRRIKQNAAPGDKLFLNSSLIHKRYLKNILKDCLTVYFYQLSEKNFICSHSVPRIISSVITLMFEIKLSEPDS